MCISPSSYRKLAELIGNYVIRVCHVNNYKVLKGDMGKLCAYEKKTGPWKRVGILLSNKHNKEVFLESPSQRFFFFLLKLMTDLLLDVQVMRPLPSPKHVQSTIIQP